ncbi:MAG: hypothetical protein VX874_09430 [Pseudomonadota bacterium]|nr:hypothetical protein [Pseudomonadota bacterium]
MTKKPASKSTRWPPAVLANWFDLAPEDEAAFDEWHNFEHVPERLGVPGFTLARRYTAWPGPGAEGHGKLMLYDATELSVFASPAYGARLDNPTPWTARVVPLIRNMTRTAYTLTEVARLGHGSFIQTIRLARDPDSAEALGPLVDTLMRHPMISGVAVGRPDTAVTHYKDATTEGKSTDGRAESVYPWCVFVEATDDVAFKDAPGIVRNALRDDLRDAHGYRATYLMSVSDLP